VTAVSFDLVRSITALCGRPRQACHGERPARRVCHPKQLARSVSQGPCAPVGCRCASTNPPCHAFAPGGIALMARHWPVPSLSAVRLTKSKDSPTYTSTCLLRGLTSAKGSLQGCSVAASRPGLHCTPSHATTATTATTSSGPEARAQARQDPYHRPSNPPPLADDSVGATAWVSPSYG
jgi:hypothetical protein